MSLFHGGYSCTKLDKMIEKNNININKMVVILRPTWSFQD